MVKCRYNIYQRGYGERKDDVFKCAVAGDSAGGTNRDDRGQRGAAVKICAKFGVSLETRNANMEGCRTISVRDLIRSSLRMRPDSLMMKKRKSKHNKKGPPSHAASRMTRLAISFFSSIVSTIKVGQKCLDLGALIFCVFQGCRVPSFFLGELPLPFSTSEARRPASISATIYLAAEDCADAASVPVRRSIFSSVFCFFVAGRRIRRPLFHLHIFLDCGRIVLDAPEDLHLLIQKLGLDLAHVTDARRSRL